MSRIQHLISYDISDNKRRRRLSKGLEGIGCRVQESVFETYMSLAEIMRIVEGLRHNIVPLEGDSLRVYRVCASCSQFFIKIGGKKIDWESDILY